MTSVYNFGVPFSSSLALRVIWFSSFYRIMAYRFLLKSLVINLGEHNYCLKFGFGFKIASKKRVSLYSFY